MTNRQKELILEAYHLEIDIKLLNSEINKKQERYIEIINELYNSISPENKEKTKALFKDDFRENCEKCIKR